MVVRAQVTPAILSPPFTDWRVFGSDNLFMRQSSSLAVEWNSSGSNSFCYYPLGLTLTRADRFQISFILKLDEIAIGTTPGKASTFEIAAGLLNTSNAFSSGFLRGTGIDPAHGPRNLLELDYFPDSGFGATVAPTVATESNQIAFSDNHPVELEPGVWHKFEMSFSPEDQTLRTTLAKSLDGADFPDPMPLRDLSLNSSWSDFRLNAIAVPNYSDAGQPAPFAGSIQAAGVISSFSLTIFDRPRLEISRADSGVRVRFETNERWKYQVESSSDALQWLPASDTLTGTGSVLSIFVPDSGAAARIFRIRAERP
jgi:hypothetical protein